MTAVNNNDDNVMNTVAKGDRFEAIIREYFEEEVNNDRLFVNKNRCSFFSKKGYYSKDRGKDIVFDVSIENRLPDQDGISLLCLIECKSYSRPVQVDDVEEFYSKIQQVSGANIKGIIASNNSFQEGAVNFARSKGIGLLRYHSRDDMKWHLPRATLRSGNYGGERCDRMSIYRGITEESFRSLYYECYCCIGDKLSNYLSDIIHIVFGHEYYYEDRNEHSGGEEHNIVRYVPDDEIERLCCRALDSVNYQGGAVDLEAVTDYHQRSSGLSVNFDQCAMTGAGAAKILGMISFNPSRITIYPCNHSCEESVRFTLAHELGHYSMNHQSYMIREYYEDVDMNIGNTVSLGNKSLDRIETQANMYASRLLLPEKELLKEFNRLLVTYDIRDRRCGALYLDDQRCNIDNYHNVVGALKKVFNVSKEAIKIRLSVLGVLTEKA